jgi:uncharacterized membrane protein YciS (DUF1049 family)
MRNDQPIVLDYFIGSSEFYFSVWLVAAFALGAILGMLSILPIVVKLKREILQLNRAVKVNEKEINNLRVLPIKE